MTFNELIPALYGPGGVIAIFVIVAVLGFRGDWRFKREVEERDVRIREQAVEIQDLRRVAYRSVLTGEEARVLSRRLTEGLTDAVARSEEFG